MFDCTKFNVLLLFMLFLAIVVRQSDALFDNGLVSVKCTENCQCTKERNTGKVKTAECVVGEANKEDPLQCNVEWPVLVLQVHTSYLHNVVLVRCRWIRRLLIGSESEITGLNYAMFQHSGKLETLVVKVPKLRGIGNSFLKHLSSLRHLDITESRISEVHSRMFQECPIKQRLRMSVQLRSISPGAFKACTSLKQLDLNHNHLNKLNQACFQGMLSLQKLDLAYNRIQTVVPFTFSSLAQLESLDLSHNLITAVSSDTFARLDSLRSLKLHNNDISHVAIDAFRGLRALTYLDLRNNNVRSLDLLSFSGLTNLRSLYLPEIQCVNEATANNAPVSTSVSREFRKFPLCSGKPRKSIKSQSNQNNKLVQFPKVISVPTKPPHYPRKEKSTPPPLSVLVMFERYPHLLPMLLGGFFVMIMSVIVIAVVCHLKNKQIRRLRFQEIQQYPVLQSTL